jgi:hypothetical protein
VASKVIESTALEAEKATRAGPEMESEEEESESDATEESSGKKLIWNFVIV